MGILGQNLIHETKSGVLRIGDAVDDFKLRHLRPTS